MNTLLLERITKTQIFAGKPCIRGLRYPVETILEWLASDMSIEEILEDYSDLEKADIMAAINFAAQMVKVKQITKLAA